MREINCSYCKRPIISKKDLVLGTHLANIGTPYHVSCFDKAKKTQGVFSMPIMKIEPNKFNFFLGMNIFNTIL